MKNRTPADLAPFDLQRLDDEDPVFQVGGYDEFQMRAEHRALKERNVGRNHRAMHHARHAE